MDSLFCGLMFKFAALVFQINLLLYPFTYVDFLTISSNLNIQI